jgi:hypothetical protein
MHSDWPPKEDPVHDVSTVDDHRADLLAVDRLRCGRAAVADQPGDVLDRHVSVGQQRDKAVPQLTWSPLAGVQPGCLDDLVEGTPDV